MRKKTVAPKWPPILLIGLGCLLLFVAAVAIQLASAQSNSKLPADKQQVVDQVAASQAAADKFALAHPELLPSVSPGFVTTGTPVPWPQGLFDQVTALPNIGFHTDNEWQWDLQGTHIQVYAGYDRDIPLIGVLVVHATGMDLHSVPSLDGWYEAQGAGDLHIAGYDGTILTVQSKNEGTFYFDAGTRAFTDANGNPVPTGTPRPTPTPAPSPGGTLPFPFPTDAPTPTPPATAQPTVAATTAAGLGG